MEITLPQVYPLSVLHVIEDMVAVDDAARPSLRDAQRRLAATVQASPLPAASPRSQLHLKEQWWATWLPKLATQGVLRSCGSVASWLAIVLDACLVEVRGGHPQLADPTAALAAFGLAVQKRVPHPSRSRNNHHHQLWTPCIPQAVELMEACCGAGSTRGAEMVAAAAFVLAELASSAGEWHDMPTVDLAQPPAVLACQRRLSRVPALCCQCTRVR